MTDDPFPLVGVQGPSGAFTQSQATGPHVCAEHHKYKRVGSIMVLFQGSGTSGGDDEDGSGLDEMHPTWVEYRRETPYTAMTARTRHSTEELRRVMAQREWDKDAAAWFRVTGDGRGFIWTRMEVQSWEELLKGLDS